MRTKLAIALVAPLLLTGGCGASKDATPEFDGPVVPWTAAEPSQLAERRPAASVCRAADLAMHGQIDFESNGNGGGIAVLALQHKGSQPCRLEGNPKVKLVKDGGP